MIAAMSPKKVNNFDTPGLSFDKANGVYIWRNKYAKKPARWKASEFTLAQVKRECEELNRVAKLQAAIAKKRELQPPTVGEVIELYLATEFHLQGWRERTAKNYLGYFRRYQREFGELIMAAVDRVFLGDWLDNIPGKADTRNGHRHLLIQLWQFAISKGIVRGDNEATATLKRSQSVHVPGNQKVTQKLDVGDFWQLHSMASDWIQVAMELHLLTLQARQEVCNMHRSHVRDGHLFVIRGKTAYDSDMAFIKIPITPSLEETLRRGSRLQPLSPFFVSKKPVRIKLEHSRAKPHPFYVPPEYYGKQFSRLRDRSGLFDNLAPAERPGTHEMRALAGKLLEESGGDAQQYYGHGDRSTTDIYTRDPRKVTDEDYRPVAPGLDLRAIR